MTPYNCKYFFLMLSKCSIKNNINKKYWNKCKTKKSFKKFFLFPTALKKKPKNLIHLDILHNGKKRTLKKKHLFFDLCPQAIRM